MTDFAHSGQIRRIVSTASSSVDNASHPVAFARPYPLPSTGSVQFDWSIAHAARVSLAILDVRGRLVRAVAVPRALPVGHHHAIWDGLDSHGRAVQPGIYFARLEVDRLHRFNERRLFEGIFNDAQAKRDGGFGPQGA